MIGFALWLERKNESLNESSFADVYDHHDWAYCEQLIKLIDQAYPYLKIPRGLRQEQIVGILDSLRNNNLKGAVTILYKLGAVTKMSAWKTSEDSRMQFAADQWNYYWNLSDKVSLNNIPKLQNIGRVLPPIMINQTALDQTLRVGRDKKSYRR